MEYRPGANILETDVDCIVNPVNCVGRMGKGLAKAFQERFPGIMEPYTKACSSRQMKPGMVQMVGVDRATGRKAARGEADLMVANIATKDHWRDNSQLEWIDRGLEKLAGAIEQRGIRSVALPALGAGLGKLAWPEVRDKVEKHFRPLSEKGVKVLVCAEGPEHEAARDVDLAAPPKEAIRYAGIGARAAPLPVQSKMQKIGKLLGRKGWVLRSGAADGADQAFERGADEAQAHKEVFLPFPGFNGRQPDGRRTFADNSEGHRDLARKYHPKGGQLEGATLELMARNSSQLMGRDLKQPSSLVICWTEGGKVKGGTGQALRMANAPEVDIPVLNLGDDRFRRLSAEAVVRIAEDVVSGEPVGRALLSERARARDAELA